MRCAMFRNKCQKTSKSNDVLFCFFQHVSEWRTKIIVTGWFDNGSRVKLGFLLPLTSVPACFDLVQMLHSPWLQARTKKEKKRLPVSWKHRLESPDELQLTTQAWCAAKSNETKKRSWSHTAQCVCTCACVESEARWAEVATICVLSPTKVSRQWLHHRSIPLDDLFSLALSCIKAIPAGGRRGGGAAIGGYAPPRAIVTANSS